MKKKLFSLLFLSFALTSFNAYSLECVPAGPPAPDQTQQAIEQPEVVSEALAAAKAKVEEVKAEVEKVKVEADQYYNGLVAQGYTRASAWFWTKWQFRKKIRQAEDELREAKREEYEKSLHEKGYGKLSAKFWSNFDKVKGHFCGVIMVSSSFYFCYVLWFDKYVKSGDSLALEDFKGPVLQKQCLPELNVPIPSNSSVVVFNPNKVCCSRSIKNGEVSCFYGGIKHIFPVLCPADITDSACDGRVKSEIVALANKGVFLPFDKRDYHLCGNRDGMIQCWKAIENPNLICSKFNPRTNIVVILRLERLLTSGEKQENTQSNFEVGNRSISSFDNDFEKIFTEEMDRLTSENNVADYTNAPNTMAFLDLLKYVFVLANRVVVLPDRRKLEEGYKQRDIKNLKIVRADFKFSLLKVMNAGQANAYMNREKGFVQFYKGKNGFVSGVAFTLGHEVGHAVQGDALSLFLPLIVTIRNPQAYIQKNRELNADIIGALFLLELGYPQLVKDEIQYYNSSEQNDFIHQNGMWFDPHPKGNVRAFFVEYVKHVHQQVTDYFDRHAELLSDPRIELVDE
jgi:hypothetical protein